MRGRSRRAPAFSLIEVVLALGIISFAVVIVAALLPLGLKSNQASAQETRASYILTSLQSDLRNTYSATGQSLIYGLPTPYKANSAGKLVFNGGLPAVNTMVLNNTSIGLDDSETKVPIAAGAPPPYQASVIFTRIPAAGALSPIEARLVVNWPSTNTTDPSKLTSLANGGGYLETYVTFPAP